MSIIKKMLLPVIFLTTAISSCKKDAHVPPVISLKTGVGFVSADGIVAKNQVLTIGLSAQKVEDNMLSLNVSYAYDSDGSTNTFKTFSLEGTEQEHCEKDISFTTRNLAGTEKWILTIADKDGNIAQKQLVLSVQ
jgi:hypothetical protein